MPITYDAAVTIQAEAKRDAERILKRAWVSHHFPVDPVRIARALGLEVVDVELDGNVAGAIVKDPGRDPIILVNKTDSANRKRFTVSHEIGHFVRHADDEFGYVDRRDNLSSTGLSADEMYANAFAANLLMPEDEVKRLNNDDVTDFEMALRFGVSRDAMAVRLSTLGIKTH